MSNDFADTPLGARSYVVGTADTPARAGIKVVRDRCLMVDHRRYGR